MIAVLLISSFAIAQEQEGKKKGGFMKAVKKGVESSTGLRVSDETLFVYPAVGEWKMAFESCVGNPMTGEVVLQIKATKLTDGKMGSTWSNLTEAIITRGGELTLYRRAADPLYNFEPNTPVDITFQTILGVPTDTKTIDVKFAIGPGTELFEARRVPITWTK